ncbi:MAG TPA: hypothetical protein VFS67_16480, partial [Polyangiaceae bacterium]|nr:hypothetical protein [Polyangiaceae bacterium]
MNSSPAPVSNQHDSAGIHGRTRGIAAGCDQQGQVLLRRAWAAARAGDEHARPWPWADTWPVA